MMSNLRVLIAGNCGPDDAAISRLLRSLGINEIVTAESGRELNERLSNQSYDLLLINRIFDATAESGLSLIERLPPHIRCCCMLISNLAEAQSAAIALGAQPGFGKRELGHPETKARILAAFNRQAKIEEVEDRKNTSRKAGESN